MTTKNTARDAVPALETATVLVSQRHGHYIVKAPYSEGFALRMRAFGVPNSYDNANRTYVVREKYRAELWTAIAHSYRGLRLVSAKGTRIILALGGRRARAKKNRPAPLALYMQRSYCRDVSGADVRRPAEGNEMAKGTDVFCECGKCDGRGTLSWTRVANGVCFACGGTGKLVATEEEVKLHFAPRAAAVAAVKGLLDRATGMNDSALNDAWWNGVYGREMNFCLLDRFVAALATAPDEVFARGLAAVERDVLPRLINGSVASYYLQREAKRARSDVFAGFRKVTTRVRKVA